MHSALKLIQTRFLHSQPGASGQSSPARGVAAPMVTAVPGTTPLVLDSPHSGTQYPADFGSACDLPTL